MNSPLISCSYLPSEQMYQVLMGKTGVMPQSNNLGSVLDWARSTDNRVVELEVSLTSYCYKTFVKKNSRTFATLILQYTDILEVFTDVSLGGLRFFIWIRCATKFCQRGSNDSYVMHIRDKLHHLYLVSENGGYNNSWKY